jgi:protein TonB
LSSKTNLNASYLLAKTRSNNVRSMGFFSKLKQTFSVARVALLVARVALLVARVALLVACVASLAACASTRSNKSRAGPAPLLKRTARPPTTKPLVDKKPTEPMPADKADTPPKTKKRGAFPRYPKLAREKKIVGFVVVMLLVDEQGKVLQVRVLKSQPPGVFDAAVDKAVRTWSFRPAVHKGRPVRVWVKQRIRFRLN